ncbi:MAG: cytochrome P450 [Pseudomonadota bacterium]
MSLDTLPLESAPFLDVADPAFSLRGPEARAARDKSWYARTPYGIAVLRHAEMGKLLVHESLRQGSHAWPAHNGVTDGLFAEWWGSSILVTEGDDHWRLRKLVNPAFSPKILRALMPEFERISNELLDDFIDAGTCDFMKDFADPYASRILCLLMGLPESAAPTILDLSSTMGIALGVNFKKHEAEIEAATQALYDYVGSFIDDRRQNPGDDILSAMAAATEDGDRLSEAELMNLAVMLAFAGVDTTRNQLGLGISMFSEHPDQWEALAADKSLDMAAAQEVMRMRPTITWVTREATEDFEFQGLDIAKGTTVHLYSESAGTDPSVFETAPFDIAAKRSRNYGFGGGIHHCLGHMVAKNDMAVAYRVLSARIKAPRMLDGSTWLADSGNTGPISLPIEFEAR